MNPFAMLILFAVLADSHAFAKTHVVKIRYNQFFPDLLTIEVGDTVEWVHESTIQHTVNTDLTMTKDKSRISIPARAVPFYSGVMINGSKFSNTFLFAGDYHYMCTFHKKMNGLIIVNEPRLISH